MGRSGGGNTSVVSQLERCIENQFTSSLYRYFDVNKHKPDVQLGSVAFIIPIQIYTIYIHNYMNLANISSCAYASYMSLYVLHRLYTCVEHGFWIMLQFRLKQRLSIYRTLDVEYR